MSPYTVEPNTNSNKLVLELIEWQETQRVGESPTGIISVMTKTVLLLKMDESKEANVSRTEL